MLTKEMSTKVVNFMIPGQNPLLWDMVQTNYMYSNDDQGRIYQVWKLYDLQGRLMEMKTKEGSSKFVN